jgi:hypothetical protein
MKGKSMTDIEIMAALYEVGTGADPGGNPATMTVNPTGGVSDRVTIFWKWAGSGGSTTAQADTIPEAIAKARFLVAHPPEFVC